MPYAQVYFNSKEFKKIELFLIHAKDGNWTKQKLLKRAVLDYIGFKEEDRFKNPEKELDNE